MMKRALTRFAAVLWPPRGLGDDAFVDRAGLIGGELFAQLRFVTAPCCALCGFSFEANSDFAEDSRCLSCLAVPPAFDRARAALYYDDASKILPLSFKHAARLDGAATFASMMARALRLGAPGEAIDLIVAIPLHPLRLWRRGYNQAGLLAQALSRRLSAPYAIGVLQRRRFTRGQSGLTAKGRARNVAGAFAIAPGWRRRLERRNVLLVDDVFTTGATLEACAGVLRRAGARRVEALTLARVMRARPINASPID